MKIEVEVVREARTIYMIEAQSLEAAEKIALAEANGILRGDGQFIIESWGTEDVVEVEWSDIVSTPEERR